MVGSRQTRFEIFRVSGDFLGIGLVLPFWDRAQPSLALRRLLSLIGIVQTTSFQSLILFRRSGINRLTVYRVPFYSFFQANIEVATRQQPSQSSTLAVGIFVMF